MAKFKRKVQNFGKSLLFPISLMSFMAIFLGLSAALQNPNIIQIIPMLENNIIQNVLGFIRKLAGLPFGYLPILFALSIPLGMVKRDKAVAVYSAVVGYLALLIGMNYVLNLQGITAETSSMEYLIETLNMSEVDATLRNSLFTETLGIFVYNTNVIGGIIAGIATVFIHNKFRRTELPESLSFYSGKKFVPIMTAIILAIIGMGITYVWPLINNFIVYIGELISESGSLGIFLYGFAERLIIPTGLHHILNQTFRFTALGGLLNADGNTIVGALNIYLFQLEHGMAFSSDVTAYLAQGKILYMIFGMPAAVFAMYRAALPEKRKQLLNFFIPGLTAVILTGITEPIEFTFIFISPILWLLNSIFAGISFLIPALLDVTIGNVQGGIIDWLVFGVLQGLETKWYIYLVVGPIFFGVYYFSFKYIIEKFNILTLGKNEQDFENEELDTKDDSSSSISETGQYIVEGLGGVDNINDIDNCISRLRVEVLDADLIDEKLINKTKPNGIIRPDKNIIHIVYGGAVTQMRNHVDDYMYNSKKGEDRSEEA